MKNNVLWICESAIMIAAATVLSIFAIIKMPFGGDVTACSMLPIILIAYRYGLKKGLFVGVIHGLIQMLLGFNNLSYATTLSAGITIVLFDYLLAFGVLGFSALFRKNNNQITAISFGTVVACFLRYICHVISGCTVWAGVSIPTNEGFIYSLVYNAAYMIPETIVTVAAAAYIGGVIDLKDSRLSRIKKYGDGTLKDFLVPVSSLVLIVTAAFDALMLFSSIQTEDGFNIANIKNAPFEIMGIVTILGLLLTVILYLIGKKRRKC